MRRLFGKMVRVIFLAFLITYSMIVNADVIKGYVISIADGDTITIVDSENYQHKIRLSGIDAPEKTQAFGNQSKQSLANMVFRKTVIVYYNKRDKYDRIVGKVLLENEDITIEQIKRGLAWHYKKYENEQEIEDRSIYANEEYLARRDKKGVWSDSSSIPPWEFRMQARVNY